MRRRQRKPTARQRSLVPLCEQKRRAEEHVFLVLSVVKQSCNQAHLHSQAQKRARLTTTEAAVQASTLRSLQVFLSKSLHRSFCPWPSLVSSFLSRSFSPSLSTGLSVSRHHLFQFALHRSFSPSLSRFLCLLLSNSLSSAFQVFPVLSPSIPQKVCMYVYVFECVCVCMHGCICMYSCI